MNSTLASIRAKRRKRARDSSSLIPSWPELLADLKAYGESFSKPKQTNQVSKPKK